MSWAKREREGAFVGVKKKKKKLLLVLALWDHREWRGCVGVKSAGVGDVFRSELTCWPGRSRLSVRGHKSSPCAGETHTLTCTQQFQRAESFPP